MIIYGWSSTNIASARSPRSTCPNCKEQGSLVTNVFSKHTHIFWIPLFPYGKKGVSQSQNCGFVMDGKKQMTEEVLREYNELKSDSRPPIWQFAGTTIVAILVSWLFISEKMDDTAELEYLASPMVGDVWEYRTDDRNYSLFRVTDIRTDTVFVLYNDYVSDKMTAVGRLNTDTCFSTYFSYLTISELQGMHSEGTLYGVTRN